MEFVALGPLGIQKQKRKKSNRAWAVLELYSLGEQGLWLGIKGWLPFG